METQNKGLSMIVTRINRSKPASSLFEQAFRRRQAIYVTHDVLLAMASDTMRRPEALC